jgi:DNA-binding CsgD family transcriptional regulator
VARPSIHVLTGREREVAALLADGLSNKLIARRLCVAVSTVKNHIHNILDKWEVRSRGEAAAHYRQKISEDELGLLCPARSSVGPTVRAWSDAPGPATFRSARPAPFPVDPQGRLAAAMAE